MLVNTIIVLNIIFINTVYIYIFYQTYQYLLGLEMISSDMVGICYCKAEQIRCLSIVFTFCSE